MGKVVLPLEPVCKVSVHNHGGLLEKRQEALIALIALITLIQDALIALIREALIALIALIQDALIALIVLITLIALILC